MRKGLVLLILITVAASLFAAPRTTVISVAKERAGRPSARFLSVVGDWIVARDDGGKSVMQVDGRQWIKGQPSAGLAAKARTIYGAKHEELIDGVKAYAYFPYSVAKDVPDFTNGEISMRFRLLGGQLDQCAGILFNLKTNGDYLTVRFNGKEDNLVHAGGAGVGQGWAVVEDRQRQPVRRLHGHRAVSAAVIPSVERGTWAGGAAGTMALISGREQPLIRLRHLLPSRRGEGREKRALRKKQNR